MPRLVIISLSPPPPGDTVTPRKGRKVTLRIVQRFHFSSALKRMSAVCSLVQASQQGPALLATAKGAPEVLKEMVSRGVGGGGGGGRTVRIVIHYKGNYSKSPPPLLLVVMMRPTSLR